MLLTSTTLNGAVSNDSNNNITMSVGNTVIANVNSSGIYFESGKKAIYTGAVLQVVSVSDTNNAIISAGSSTNYYPAGLTLTITPQSTSNKILLMGHHHQVSNNSNGDHHRFYLQRNGTNVIVGTGASAFNSFGSGGMDNNNYGGNLNAGPNIASWSFVDSPSSTSALTYRIRLEFSSGSSQTVTNTGQAYYNRSASGSQTFISTLTALEIAG